MVMAVNVASRPRRWHRAVALVLLAAAALPAIGQDYARFYGTYEGKAILHADGEMSPRDIRVSIKPEKDGFSVEWVTVIHKPDGRVKRAEFSIGFQPTRRANIFSSAMRRNLFGKAVPLDPLKGDPYVWAKIEGDRMSVYTLIITDEGGYELQTHQRTLTPDGMNLEFFRVRDGELLRTVTGSLTRVP